jgi:hypothetical protein
MPGTRCVPLVAFVSFGILATVVPSRAAELAVPPALQPWVPWVLAGHEAERCPSLPDGTTRSCAWPGPLALSVDGDGGTFSQRWSVQTATRVPLPGSAERWPQAVTVGGRDAVVLDDGGPTVDLPPGDHVVAGRFVWDAQPEKIAVPPSTALLALRVRGREVLFPRRERDDVYVDREQEQGGTRDEDSLDVAVFRKVVDDAPLLVETRLILDVAGKAREIIVPSALLPGFQAAAVGGPVPVRVEGTSLRAQVRPGSHAITVVGRSVRPDVALVAPAAFDDGPAEEIWAYEARPSLRIAHVEGPAAVSADQTRLPAEWRGLPAFRLLPGETMKLVQDRRGDVDPPPSQLTLERTLWLDFDGGGYTARDTIRGRFSGDRLEMGPATTLGHAVVDGKEAFLTSLQGGAPGVELRARSIDVVADSRIEGGGALPAVSWAHDFERAEIALHLPPGYAVVAAGGVDDVSDAWVKRWSLYEIFLVVVLSVAVLRLWGPLFMALAAAGFTLTFQEADAPVVAWVAMIVLAGLHRAIATAPPTRREHPALRVLGALRLIVAAIVALQVIAYAVTAIRVGMYPTLARPWHAVGGNDDDGGGDNDTQRRRSEAVARDAAEEHPFAQAAAAPGAPPQAEPRSGGGDDDESGGLAALVQSKSDRGDGYAAQERRVAKKKFKQLAMVDPDAVLQTGPGRPRWSFHAVQLTFSGPVRADQTIDLWLLSPTANLVLAFVRVLLLALLVLAAFGFPGDRWPTMVVTPFRRPGGVWAAMLALVLLGGGSAHAQIPDVATLNDLRSRLLAPPSCGTACVEIAAMTGEATPSSLRLSFTVHAGAAATVALPSDDGQWSARVVRVDGAPAPAARIEGRLVVPIDAGVHDVVLEGPLPARPSVQIALPRTPRRGSLRATGWTVDGVHADGSVDDNLQLSRIVREEGAAREGERGADLPPSVLPPFLLVERTVQLGLTFEVETRVVRLSPAGTPIVVDVPLLPGESVTTDGVRAEMRDGRGVVQVNLGPQDTETSWHGTLTPAATLALQAPADVPWLESWLVQESPLWHLTKAGIPPIHGADGARGITAYRPWPGESLTLSLVRPTGVDGRTLTVDGVAIAATPGLRSTDVTLDLRLRASRGAQHPVRLPAGAELIAATIGGRATPLRATDGVVVVPLVPGEQRVVLTVRLPTGVTFATTTPTFDVGAEAVNVELQLQLSEDRWVLFCAGPRTGPAVLFWSFLVVIVLVGVALGRVPASPLSSVEWVLLSLGLTQVSLAASALVAGWLFVLGARRGPRFVEPGRCHNATFDLFQGVVVLSTILGLVALLGAIRSGLLGSPDMQVEGNGSSGTLLRWFTDRSLASTPTAMVWSVPLWVFRAAMLAWSFWLVRALLRWLRDGFVAFGSGGFFREPFPSVGPTTARTSATAARSSSASTAAPRLTVPEAPPGAPTSTAAVSNDLGARSEPHATPPTTKETGAAHEDGTGEPPTDGTGAPPGVEHGPRPAAGAPATTAPHNEPPPPGTAQGAEEPTTP